MKPRLPFNSLWSPGYPVTHYLLALPHSAGIPDDKSQDSWVHVTKVSAGPGLTAWQMSSTCFTSTLGRNAHFPNWEIHSKLVKAMTQFKSYLKMLMVFSPDRLQTQQKLAAALLQFPHPQGTAGSVPLSWTSTDFKEPSVWENQTEGKERSKNLAREWEGCLQTRQLLGNSEIRWEIAEVRTGDRQPSCRKRKESSNDMSSHSNYRHRIWDN